MTGGLMSKIKNILKSDKFIYILIFISFIVLCFMFPYSQDDWDWGTKYGIERLNNLFSNYNGRWAGNLLVIALTRSNILKTIVMASFLTGIIYFLNDIIKSEKKSTIWLSYLLILATPYQVLRQGIVWTAGFSNYTTSIFFILLFVKLSKDLFEGKELKYSKRFIPLFALLGFINCLFMENITIYLVCLSIFILIYSYKKIRKVQCVHIAYFIGIICGTILMFSNSAYRTVAAGDDFYRTVDTNVVSRSVNNYFDIISNDLVFNNHILNIILAILISIIIFMVIKNKKEKKLVKRLGDIILFIVISFTLYSCVTRLMNINLLLKYTKYFNGIFAFIYCISLIFFSIFFIKKDNVKKRLLFILFSIVIMTGPLLIVTPIGSRNFLPTYILFIWFLLELLCYILSSKKTIEIEKYITKVFICMSFVLYIYLFGIYGYIYKTNIERLNYIEKNKDKSEILVPRLPYQNYMWRGDPNLEVFVDRFKTYYKIDKDTKITYVSISEWKKKK